MISFNFLITIILNLICIVTLFSCTCSLLSCIEKFFKQQKKPMDFYKIKSMSLNILIVSAYILFYVVLLYCVRLYNIGQKLDLKVIYIMFKIYWSIMPNILIKIYLIFLLILFTIFLFTVIIKIQKLCIKQMFILYIYVTHKYNLNIISFGNKYQNTYGLNFLLKISSFFSWINNNDIVSYTIGTVLERIYFKKNNKKLKMLSNILLYNDIYKRIIVISPLFVIAYDCLFNNFVLQTFYYYMLFFVPLMLVKRITYAINKTNDSITEILWNIYYNKDPQKKYIASPEEKEIIDIFVQSNLIMIPEFSLSMVEFNLKFTITYRLIDQEENIYMNNEGIYIKIIDNILYEVVEDEEGNPILKPSDYVLLS